MNKPSKSRTHDRFLGQPRWVALLPVIGAVFIAFLVIGMAMPVLPLHVHQGLGFGAFLVGLVAGSQFAAAILSRVLAGRQSDRRGPKSAVIAGLAIAAASGLLYFVSLVCSDRPLVSVTVLLLGRTVLGVGESFIIVGGQSWALTILTARNTSRALAWVGSAMFAAFAAGAPIGSAMYSRFGFSAIALATTLLPLVTLLCIVPLRGVPAVSRSQIGIMKVMASVWGPGVGAALSSIGFGAVTAFSALLFVGHGWAAWMAFTTFATVFILTRIFLGHLGDRFAALKVALASVVIEAAGLGLLWVSPSLALALAGTALTGFGYSLVYPALGVEAVRLAPAQNRGLVMGAYTAFLDVALGFGTPALGLLADHTGLGSVFAASMLAALGSAAVVAASGAMAVASAPRLAAKPMGPCLD
ncbi:MAG: arabinose transporter [Hyphomicrobiales bacterium]|nr:arabinose transporter [Hyphomicrobiales bacterium]